MVDVVSQADPNWWLGKDMSGKEGYFPANFVTMDDMEPRGSTPTEAPDVVGSSPQKPAEMAISLYAYASDEPGDLNFEAEERIGIRHCKMIFLNSSLKSLFLQTEILKKEADWWTGRIGDRTGVFPYNYVELVAPAASGPPPPRPAVSHV